MKEDILNGLLEFEDDQVYQPGKVWAAPRGSLYDVRESDAEFHQLVIVVGGHGFRDEAREV